MPALQILPVGARAGPVHVATCHAGAPVLAWEEARAGLSHSSWGGLSCPSLSFHHGPCRWNFIELHRVAFADASFGAGGGMDRACMTTSLHRRTQGLGETESSAQACSPRARKWEEYTTVASRQTAKSIAGGVEATVGGEHGVSVTCSSTDVVSIGAPKSPLTWPHGPKQLVQPVAHGRWL